MSHRLIFILQLVYLSGCASNPGSADLVTNYYLLDTTTHQISKHEASIKIVFEPIDVATYLKQPNLVLRNANNSLQVANFHLWANPLPESIQRALINDLSVLRSDVVMVERCTICSSLKLTVEHFYPNSDGIVTLSGSYIITSSEQTVTKAHFSMTDSIQTDGYHASVQTMRALLAQLAEKIGTEL